MTPIERAREAAAEKTAGALIAMFMAGWGKSAEGYNAEHGPLSDDVADDAIEEAKGYQAIAANAAIDAFLKSLAAQGLVIVPKEASEEMIQAARGFCNNERSAEFAWDAMISAYQGEGK